MKINRIMTPDPATCGPDEALTRAAAIMWHRDCGAVPIVDEQRRVVGIITDRDICIAVTSRNARARGIRIGDVMSASPVTCRPDASISDAVELMAEHQVRRLPVTNAEGVLEGMVALSDLIPLTGHGKKPERVSRKEMLRAIEAITAPRTVPVTITEVPPGLDPIIQSAGQAK